MWTLPCLLSLLAVFPVGAQEWRTPIAVDIPTTFSIDLRGIPSRCYKVVRPPDGRLTARVTGPGSWNVCVGDQACPYDCMSGSMRTVSTEPLTQGTHYYVMVERQGGDATATLAIFPTRGGAANARAAIAGTWTAVVPNKNFRKGGYRITQNGDALTLVSPDGSTSAAHYVNATTIVADQWKSTGTVSEDGRRIDWDNGSYWDAQDVVASARVAIVGTWTAVVPDRNFRKSGYRITQNGDTLTLVSWDGARSTAHYVNATTIVADQWKGTGTVSKDGKRIDWDNGSYWER